MNRTTIWVAAFLGATVLLWFACASRASSPKICGECVAIIAHRGASGWAPENTLASIQKAMELGTPVVEIDVHQTRDSILVVLHDDTIDRTTTGTGRVSELGYREIAPHSAGSWFGRSFECENVPTLKEAIETVAGHADLLIEIKHGSDTYPGIEQRVIHMIQEHDATDWCLVQSLDDRVLETVSALDSRIELHKLVVLKIPRLPIYVDTWLRVGALLGPEKISAVAVNRAFFSKYLLRELHHLGYRVHVWTVNDSLEIQQLIEDGVDGIITDFPNRGRCGS